MQILCEDASSEKETLKGVHRHRRRLLLRLSVHFFLLLDIFSIGGKRTEAIGSVAVRLFRIRSARHTTESELDSTRQKYRSSLEARPCWRGQPVVGSSLVERLVLTIPA
jgi:hypothetical protein